MGKYKKEKSKYNLILGICLVIAVFVGLVIGLSNYSSNCIMTENAFVEGKLLTANSKIAGLILNIYVSENQEVKKGDLIAELDRAFYENALRKAVDELQTTKIKLAVLNADDNSKTKSPLSKFRFNHKGFFDGYSKLYGDDINQEDTQGNDIKCLTSKESEHCLKSEQIKNQKDIKDEKNEDLPETKEDLEKKIHLLESEIEQARLNLSYTKIYAPQDGVVSIIEARQGEYIYSGQSILSIIPKRVWVNANYSESQAQNIEVGQQVDIKISKYPMKTFKGMVDCIKNDMNDKNNYLNGVLYVPVRIVFLEDYSAYDITPGMRVKAIVKLKNYLKY